MSRPLRPQVREVEGTGGVGYGTFRPGQEPPRVTVAQYSRIQGTLSTPRVTCPGVSAHVFTLMRTRMHMRAEKRAHEPGRWTAAAAH